MKLLGRSKRPDPNRGSYDDSQDFSGERSQQIHRPQQKYSQRQQYQAPRNSNEYEYVRREHGYDFMPPSRYVPSMSMSEDIDDYSDDPQRNFEMAESDLTAVEVEYEPRKTNTKTTPVVQGKTIKVTPYSKNKAQGIVESFSRTKAPRYNQEEARHRLQMKIVSEEFMQKNKRSPHFPFSPGSFRGRDQEEYKEERRSRRLSPKKQNRSNRQIDITTAQSYESEESKGIKTPKEPRYNVRSGIRAEETSRSRGTTAQGPPSPPHVPYRYGWTRSPRDVVVQDFSKPTYPKPQNTRHTQERVGAKPKEHRSERLGHRRSHSRELREPSPPEVYVEPPSEAEPRHRSRRMDQKRSSPHALAEPASEMEPRRDTRRRDREYETSRRDRDLQKRASPQALAEPASEMEPRRDTRRRDREYETSRRDRDHETAYEPRRHSRRENHDREPEQYSDPYAPPGYYKHSKPQPGLHTRDDNLKVKPKGMLGRFMNSVRGEKPPKLVTSSREWEYAERYEDDARTSQRPPDSLESEVTPYPPHRFDSCTAGVPYPFDDDEYYSQGPMRSTRGRSWSPRRSRPSNSKSPSRNYRSNSKTGQRRSRTPPKRYSYSKSPERQRRSSSNQYYAENVRAPPVYATSPSRARSPRARSKPDRREGNGRHHTKYESHIKTKGHRSPSGLQFDDAKVRVQQQGRQHRNFFGRC